MIYRLVHQVARQRAIDAVKAAPMGHVVEVKEAGRNLEQNALAHAILTDIAKQVTWKGMKFPKDVWKRLCMAAWMRENGKAPEMIPALDGAGVDLIYERTSRLSKEQFSEFIEWCIAFGAQNGVVFRDKHAA